MRIKNRLANKSVNIMKNILCILLLSAAVPRAGAQCITITCVANKTVACGTAWSFDPPRATNTLFCCGSTNHTVTVVSTTTNLAGPGGTCMTATRTWSAADTCGHSNTCSQVVTVTNNVLPMFAGVSNIEVFSCASTKQVFYNVTASSACCGNVPVTFNPPNGSFFPTGGVVTVTCSATDCCHNTANTSFAVLVDGASVQVTSTNKTVACGTSWGFDLPVVVDPCCGTGPSITPVSTVNSGNCTQMNVQTWRITDPCGYSNQVSQTVTVLNTNTPVFQNVSDHVLTSCTNVQYYYPLTATSPP